MDKKIKQPKKSAAKKFIVKEPMGKLDPKVVEANIPHSDLPGRKTKYSTTYCDFFIQEMSKGYSKFAVCGALGIHEATLYIWEERYPELKKAIKIGEKKAILFFERALINKAMGRDDVDFSIKDSNAACIIFALKTRFHHTYKDEDNIEEKREQTLTDIIGSLPE